MNYFCLWLCEMWTGHSAGTMLLSADCNVCVSASGLSVVLFSVTQEELLNRLMVFGTAGTVDSLCHLNAWGRCSIPIHALQVQTHSTCDAPSYIHLSSVLKVLLCLPETRSVMVQWLKLDYIVSEMSVSVSEHENMMFVSGRPQEPPAGYGRFLPEE